VDAAAVSRHDDGDTASVLPIETAQGASKTFSPPGGDRAVRESL